MDGTTLFDRLVSYENLIAAAGAAAKGRRRRDYVIDFEREFPEHLVRLRRELLDGSYTPGPYREFYVYEHKLRKISAAPYRDRVVHHALCNVIYPLLERRLGSTVFANRVGMGSQRAVLLAQRYLRKYRYFLKIDVRNFFPSIDHEILKHMLRRIVPCPRTKDLTARIIDGSNSQDSEHAVFPGDDLFTWHERRRGLPIGNLTSQHFSNFFLHPVDHAVRDRAGVRAYIRYVDDLLLFHDDKRALQGACRLVKAALGGLRLRMHENRAQVTPATRPLTFLGYIIERDHLRVLSPNLVRTRRRTARRLAAFRRGDLDINSLRSAVFGWIGYAALGGLTRCVRDAAGTA